jgi:hypothetical protein
MPANTQVQNVKLGACDVNYDSVDLGLTKGGVQVNITTTKHEVKVDQFGETIANDIIMGRQGTVTVPMAETDLTKLAKVIPGATLVTDTTTPTKKKLLIPTGAGISLMDTAAKLVLHPTANDVANKADDVTVPLAGVSGDIQFAFQVDQERVYNVTFTMYPDEDGLLLIFGDETAVAA